MCFGDYGKTRLISATKESIRFAEGKSKRISIRHSISNPKRQGISRSRIRTSSSLLSHLPSMG